MEQRNNVTEFVLLGLTQSIQGQKILFVVFLFIYIVTMVGNLLIVLTVVVSPILDTPMYFFLGCLSFMDAIYSTNSHTKYDYRLTVWKENHFLPSLHGPAFYRALIWWCWDFAPGGHGLWPLHGHLQTLALFDHHE